MAAPTKPQTAVIRAGVVGAAHDVAPWLSTLRQSDAFELAAQSGLPQAAALPDIAWHDDTRRMFNETELDAVLLLCAPRDATHFATEAAQRGLHVWQRPPVGSHFAEAVELVNNLGEGRVAFRVASWWQFARETIVWALEGPDTQRPRHAVLRLHAPGPPDDAWAARRSEGACGPLPAGAYRLLETLIGLRGLPDAAFGTLGVAGRVRREVEDIQAALLRYEDGGVCSVQAAWDLPPAQARLELYAPHRAIVLSERRVTAFDEQGAEIDAADLPGDYHQWELSRFADLIRNPAQRDQRPVLHQHLAVTAALDAVFLSARTGQPEAPRKFYRVQGWPEPR